MLVKVKPSNVISSMFVQCKGVEDRAAIKDTVESLDRLGYPELIASSDDDLAVRSFRDAVAREKKERFGFRATAFQPSESHSYCDGERVLNNDATEKKGQFTDKLFDGIFLAWSEESTIS